jgi:hypothetical protein
MTKNTLNLIDVLLERVRSELVSNLIFGAEVEGGIDIGGDTDIEEKIDQHLQPAVQALAFALRIAESAGVVPDEFLLNDSLFFVDENNEVRMAPFSDVERVWRPLPPGPDDRLEELPPEDVEIPEPLDPKKVGGPIQ